MPPNQTQDCGFPGLGVSQTESSGQGSPSHPSPGLMDQASYLQEVYWEPWPWPLLLPLSSVLAPPRPLLGFGKEGALSFTCSKHSSEGPPS